MCQVFLIFFMGAIRNPHHFTGDRLKIKRPDRMVGALLLLWMNQSMLNKIPPAVFTLVGLLRLSGIILA
jgi:hypothetical protein